MSGVEFIIGTVIGVIPLILEAYDRYGKIAGAVKTLRHPQRQFDILHAQIITQQTLFRNSISKLLVALTDDPQKAKDLLSNERDWNSLEIKNLGQRRLEILRDTFEVWKRNARHIHESLRLICSQLEGLRDQPILDTTVKRFGKRLKLALKKNDFRPLVTDLRELMSDFKDLTLSIVDEVKDVQDNKATGSGAEIAHSRAANRKTLAVYQQTQNASNYLHEVFALRWGCATHAVHVASIMCGSEGHSTTGLPENVIKFETYVRGSELKSLNSLRFEVQYTNEVTANKNSQEIQQEKDWSLLLGTLVEHTEAMTLNGTNQKHKTVRFRDIKEMEALENTARISSDPIPSIDLVDVDDACHHFQTNKSTDWNQCIAHVRHNGLYRFYQSNKNTKENSICAPTSSQRSLAEVIAWYSEDELRRQLPRSSTVSLASRLSNAVLQYHSTPWLPDSWHSSSVRFFGIEDLMQQEPNSLVFPSPYFEVAFSRSDVKGKAKVVADEMRCSGKAAGNRSGRGVNIGMRNKVLFHFGIVLLELGHGRPWNQLRLCVLNSQNSPLMPVREQHQDTNIIVAEDEDDYWIAEQLTKGRWADILRNKVAPHFPLLVRKCLYCDFNTGENDLGNEKLQRAFLDNVIYALRDVEMGLREFQARWGMLGA